MQTAIRSLLKEELAEVRRRNEIVCLRVEAIRTASRSIVRVISLALVQARLSVRAAAFLAHSQRAAFRAIDSLTIDIDRFLANLAAMNIYINKNEILNSKIMMYTV